MIWDSQITTSLKTNNYQDVVEFYEAKISETPDNISLYWYLGLAYLLGEKEDEAVGTWLTVFSEGDSADIEAWTKELITILETEATRQVELENKYKAWLIRQQILELNPDLVNNLLHLINLEVNLGEYKPEKLREWRIYDLLEANSKENIDIQLLLKTLDSILPIPTYESVEFAETVIKKYSDINEVLNKIVTNAEVMTYEKGFPLYALDLHKVCTRLDPNNLFYYKNQFWCLIEASKLQEALPIAEEFLRRSDSIVVKVFAYYQLLYVYMRQADWSKVVEETEKYKQLIKGLTEEKPLIVPMFLIIDFIIVGNPLLYIEDNPKENRPLINQIGKIFQEGAKTVIHPPEILERKNRTTKHQKLRIGYVAHTLRRHSVGWLSRWLFHYHDKEAFSIHIYLLSQQAEEFTKTWFEPYAESTQYFDRNIKELIEQIKADEIDILVDLDSITLNLTCQIMSYKLAPIQITWLGLDASGIPAIDYFIADPYVLPDDAQNYYQETIWRLPKTYLAVDGFEVAVPTISRESLDIPEDAIIYLNIQNSKKRHPQCLELQMEILKAVPNSYFLTKGTGDTEIIKEVFTKAALDHGINPERLRFLDRTPNEETHRANLAIADVILDTYPYNGATTTLEVLWMGIPLVTRVGEQFAARNSYTFMKNAGISEGIAWTDAEYVEWGIKLAKDANLRREIIWKLRESRRHAPLWKAKEFTQEMEKAYQQMWQIYCEQKSK